MARILLIDDSDEFRDVFKEILERSGYIVVDAAGGDEGIRRYKENPVDLVITDIVMPGKEGLETMMELRRANPAVKIIAISGGGFEDPSTYLEGAALLGGAIRTFTKPFPMDKMLLAIKEVLAS